VLGYITRTGLRTPVIFTDFYAKTEVTADSKPIQIWVPVNPANNVARTYTESDRQRLVKTATTALEEITWAAAAVSYDDLIAAGSLPAARAVGKARIEGKDYVMKDGDVVEFRFNV
jgi:ribosome-binding ATPase YchF (GTP1/OBG family)